MTESNDTPDEPDKAPEPAARSAPSPTPLDGREVAKLREAIGELHDLVAAQHAADVHGLTKMLGSKRKLIAVNLLTGLSRGVGFFLGATLIGALLIGGTAYFVDATAEAFGLKEMTTRRMVSALYSKFREIKDVVDGLEAQQEAEGEMIDESADTDLGR